jgi:hypothetical protein
VTTVRSDQRLRSHAPQQHFVPTAIVGHHAEYVIVGPLVVQRFRVPDDPFHVDDERLIRSEYFIFADVAELRRAIPIGGLDSDDLAVDPSLVHLSDVARFRERGCVLVHIRHCYVNGGAAITTKKIHT